MPFLKLWNSLIGRPTAVQEPVATVVAAAPQPTAKAAVVAAKEASVAPVQVSTSGSESIAPRKQSSRRATKVNSESNVRLATAKTGVLSTPEPITPARQPKVVTRGEHAEICKLAIASGALSVLEIGVGDATRAEAVMQSLQAVSGDKVLRYSAIDQFEMVGGPITLKDFHHRMRGVEVRPQVFPEAVVQGLARFSRTVGFADLVIASIPDAVWDSAEVQALVHRITRTGSIALHQRDGRWHKLTLAHSHPTNSTKAA